VKTLFSVGAPGRLVDRAVDHAQQKAGEAGEAGEEVELLLAAAEVALAEQGYAGLRVDDVLDAAGMSTRAFYRQFRGKSELFLALFDREMTRAQQRLSAKLARASTPEAKVGAWAAAMLALAYDARLSRRTRLFLVERQVIAREFPDEIARCVRLMLEPLEGAIADGRDGGMFPDADPQRDALAIHHLCTGLMTDRLLGIGGGLSRDEAVALATRFALTTLQSGP
jgi:AcrR family transcriptional regulator